MKKKIAVICARREYFDNFLRASVDYEDKDKYVCVTSTRHTRGYLFSESITIGNLVHIKDYVDINDAVERRINVGERIGE